MDASRSWAIDLAVWIIQDGNYPDFEKAQSVEFAVEFWPVGELAATTTGTRSARHLADATYGVDGEVIALGELW